MHPARVKRERVVLLTDLPNIGPAMAADLQLLGISRPEQLSGRDPYVLYEALCARTGERHDPCVIDVFISAVRFMEGGEARVWWDFTAERKGALLVPDDTVV
ncbi:helix-hairpin-helix domain-containing protein [Silvimonas iriomotensis]|uniref:Mitomycin resistance protein n=1 Tax=Silvimonas iriomotensis TaxID=449662 RepID=A0ABQ2P978_9NEIS|nr:helix-hairpin-helix domain-containing protein [Silvimonas iriomotensis]GGP20925.1 hypothetical protein GCM10010970_17640 [Silvimonas iriomotensis]